MKLDREKEKTRENLNLEKTRQVWDLLQDYCQALLSSRACKAMEIIFLKSNEYNNNNNKCLFLLSMGLLWMRKKGRMLNECNIILYQINTVLYRIKVNNNTIELTVHTSGYLQDHFA